MKNIVVITGTNSEAFTSDLVKNYFADEIRHAYNLHELNIAKEGEWIICTLSTEAVKIRESHNSLILFLFIHSSELHGLPSGFIGINIKDRWDFALNDAANHGKKFFEEAKPKIFMGLFSEPLVHGSDNGSGFDGDELREK